MLLVFILVIQILLFLFTHSAFQVILILEKLFSLTINGALNHSTDASDPHWPSIQRRYYYQPPHSGFPHHLNQRAAIMLIINSAKIIPALVRITSVKHTERKRITSQANSL